MGSTPPPLPQPPATSDVTAGVGVSGEDPHEKILATLSRIEEKLAAIAAKVGA